MISGHGPTSAKAIIVSDGATDTDLRSGLALSGDQERLLASFAKANRLSFQSDFWKTALIKERVDLKHPEKNFHLLTDQWKNIFLGEVHEINPNVIVPLSELSFNFLTGLSGIKKFRGSVLPLTTRLQQIWTPSLKIIPTLGPNPYLYEDMKMEFITRLDFGKVAKNLYETSPIKEVGYCWICKSSTELRNFISRSYKDAKFLVFDIETYANTPTCISFCFDGNESVCVPFMDRDISFAERVMMFHLVAKLLRSPIPKVNQNIKFDERKLRRVGLTVNNITGDTLLAASCLYCEFPKNLGFLTSIYTDMPYFKDEGKDFDPSSHDRSRLYLYNAKDSLSTHQIMTQQEAEIVEQGVEKPYKCLIEILPIYRTMEENGLLVDDTQRKKLLDKYWTLYDIHRLKLWKMVGRKINPLSSQLISKLVFEELGFDSTLRGVKRNKPSKKNPEGSIKADEETLELLIWTGRCTAIEGKLILRSIIDCRKIHKVIELLEAELYPDQRLRCEFNLAGAETGRTTASSTTDYKIIFDSGKLKFVNIGHSFQTIGKHGFTVDGVTYGKDIRSIYVPTPGYSFVEIDLSQAEARVDAVLARDFDILSIFDSPIGIHKLTGSWVFDCPPEDIKKNTLVLNSQGVGEDRYHIAKTVRHAGERNMREDRLMLMIHKPIFDCKKILDTFHKKQSNIREVFHREVREAVRTRLLVAPNGRRRDFFGRFDENQVNEGISFLPQAIVTDYMKEGIRRTFPQVKDFIRPIAEAHDGFFCEVLKDREIEYAKVFTHEVQQPIDFEPCTLSRQFKLVIPAEAAISNTNWEEMRDLKI